MRNTMDLCIWDHLGKAGHLRDRVFERDGTHLLTLGEPWMATLPYIKLT